MKKVSELSDCRIESYDLSDEQHEMVVEMVKNGSYSRHHYTLDKADKEMVEDWISDTDDVKYGEFLKKALNDYGEVYTLTYYFGDFSQPIGEVVIYDI